MMRKLTALMLSLLLVLSLGICVSAAAESEYIFDDADLLSPREEEKLDELAETIEEEYGCTMYIMTVEDYRDYGSSSDVFEVTYEIYHDRDLGYGKDRNGVILLLSMEDRDFALFVYGDDAEYAFDSYGQELLEEEFLDDFADDDWYNGFHDYLSTGEEFLEMAEDGEPVRESPAPLIGLLILISCGIAAVVVAVLWGNMKSVKVKSGAATYAAATGLNLTNSMDLFSHRTVHRRTIPKNNGSSGARSGGGGSGRSGKF